MRLSGGRVWGFGGRAPGGVRGPWWGLLASITAFVGVASGCSPAVDSSVDASHPLPPGWVERVTEIRWVDYNPSEGNPDDGIAPSVDSIAADLAVLREAGFTGLVTYGPPGLDALLVAEEAGFEGVIVGIWDPTREAEIDEAIEAASSEIVLGYCVGNEGIMRGDYTLADVEAAAARLRSTGLPLTTTEMSAQYPVTPGLLEFGDWVFPNIHPFHSRILDPVQAVEWTEGEYDALAAGTDRFVMVKETGLPHDGAVGVSEQSQLDFYLGLAETDVPFVYFEAFDGAWKDWAPYEPYWGLFHPDRSPTALGESLTDGG